MTKADGTKYGKTEGGALWLDPEMMSPYAFYQFWLNVEDEKVGELLRIFTFLSRAEIEELEAQHAEKPFLRAGQRALAEQVTTLVHGAEETERIKAASAALFGGGDLPGAQRRDPGRRAARGAAPTLDGDELCRRVVDLLVATGLAKSKGEARRTVAEGGAYLNNVRVEDPDLVPGAGRPDRRHLAGAAPRQEELRRRRGALTERRRRRWLDGARGACPRGRCPPRSWTYVLQGARDVGHHGARPSRPWRRVRLLPAGAPRRDRRSTWASTVLGERLEVPWGVAPTTLQRAVHPEGELAMAQATAAPGR